MIGAWLVRLALARDDDGPLSDEGIEALTQRLVEDQVQPVLSRSESGTVLVQLTVEARNEMGAQAAAEHVLRDGANTVWSALGLPPFTIAFVDAKEAHR